MIAFYLYTAYGKRNLALVMYDFDGEIYCATSHYYGDGFIGSWIRPDPGSLW